MDASSSRGARGRGAGLNREAGGIRGRSRNRHWQAPDSGTARTTPNHVDGERWERGGHRGAGRGRGSTRGAVRTFPNVSLRLVTPAPPQHQSFDPYPEVVPAPEFINQEDDENDEVEEVGGLAPIHEPVFSTPEEFEQFYQELVKAREQERKLAIAEGKMDDPLVPKRLEDAITIVGTCMDMCPRFERYRRERENNLGNWEVIEGTKHIDHNRVVKMYERGAGDKVIPSDLRPPLVLKKTLDYLFHDLLPRGGFHETAGFIRDRTRAVRNDFTMQHVANEIAIECHDRCVRFHILALHVERDVPGFSMELEDQQLMNALQSLKEFYTDQRGCYQSPTELEMRIYHRLIHIRDQRHHPDDTPEHILQHPVFKLTTAFRLHVQEKSAPLKKNSTLVVGPEGMLIFAELARVLNEQGSKVMVYLVACILERLFGKDTIDDIDLLRGDLTFPEIIDGVSTHHSRVAEVPAGAMAEAEMEENDEEGQDEDGEEYYPEEEDDGAAPEPALQPQPQPTASVPRTWPANAATPQAPKPIPAAASAFAGIVATPNVFGPQSIFGAQKPATPSLFGGQTPSVFGNIFGGPAATPPSTSVFSAAPAAPSLFSAATITSTPSNFFNIKSTTPFAAASSPQQPNIFGGAVNGSPFSNPSGVSSTQNLPAPTSLTPTAPAFIPPQPKTSIFSQPISFPSTPTTNGIPKSDTTATATTMTPNPPSAHPSTAEPEATEFFNFTPVPTPPTHFSKPTPLPSKSTTPPSARPAMPALKIDTTPSVSSNSSNASPAVGTTAAAMAAAAASPRVPPLMPKKQPISLPTTPTTVLQPPSAHLGYLRSTLERSGSGSSSFGSAMDLSWGGNGPEVLSPLVMGSPVAGESSRSFNNFTPLSTPKATKRFRTGSSPPPPSSPVRKSTGTSSTFGLPKSPGVNGNGKGKARNGSISEAEVKEMEGKALAFVGKSVLVKECFERWVQLTTDHAAYLEARQRDEEYRLKLRKSVNGRSSSQFNSRQANGTASPLDKKRRMSSSMNGIEDGRVHGMSPHKKRARKRASGEYRPPRTDEELAKRFKENHEEHEQRWSKGSFLQDIRKNVAKLNSATLKLPWNVWLSMNPESDATAIWLERKFDVPASGTWASEAVFSIPLSSAGGPASVGYPGLIVFECTPLGDVTDELEKKYRVLDDCSRLRDIIKSLSPKRHFVPSLLVISWAEQDEISKTSDFITMIRKLIDDAVLRSYQVFAITSGTKDLDTKLNATLNMLTLDTEGQLVKSLSLDNAFDLFEPAFNAFSMEWIENCTINGRFNWVLYGQLVQASVALLNVIFRSVQTLLELSGPLDMFPNFDQHQLNDSESCYDTVNQWLSTLGSRDDAELIALDLQSHRNLGQDFPGKIFIDHLFESNQTRFEQIYRKTIPGVHAVLITSITTSLDSFKDAIRPHQLKLSQVYNFNARRSPKRRAYSVSTSEPTGSPEAKRPRLSASMASSANGDEIDDSDGIRTVPTTPTMNGNRRIQTPSPTGSASSAAVTDIERPTVTVAMLRALTRDLKKKYAVGS